MCLIVDTNRFSAALSEPPEPAYLPLIEWILNEDGAVVLGGRKYKEEIARHSVARRFFAKLVQAGRAFFIPDALVDADEMMLCASRCCTSDDEHVVALARISGARVVCTEDDKLMSDIKNHRIVSRPRGRIYRRASHRRLLRHDKGCLRPPNR